MKKNGKKNSQKHPLQTAAKVVTIVLAAWFSCAMPVQLGADIFKFRSHSLWLFSPTPFTAL